MNNNVTAGKAALAATAVLAGLSIFQLLLAAGAPFGQAAWGGTHEGTLPTGLRIGSAVAVVLYAGAAALVLRRAGFRIRWVSAAVARIGTWVVTALLVLGALGNVASSSPWERAVLGPVTFVLAGLFLVVARSAEEPPPVPRPTSVHRQAAH